MLGRSRDELTGISVHDPRGLPRDNHRAFSQRRGSVARCRLLRKGYRERYRFLTGFEVFDGLVEPPHYHSGGLRSFRYSSQRARRQPLDG